MTLAVVLALAAGTFGIRFAGPQLRNRLTVPMRVQMLLSMAATALLLALVTVNAFVPGGKFGGWALIAGVAVGGVAAWRKAPFVLVVVLAAATTAALRLVGVV
ncbi:AzlD domain-containing protein [Kutzneria sp. NPDC052558]|uniref:AzlD domain-containing protein n=1 Tax=Kutzneria sp. NPDC052558 TaxID=3364121 RepID=UPI0037C51735